MTYTFQKPKVNFTCSTCCKSFLGYVNKKRTLKCPKRRNEENFTRYYKAKSLDPEWRKNRSINNAKYAKGAVTKLYRAKIALERLLDQVEKKRIKIKKLEMEVKNGS